MKRLALVVLLSFLPLLAQADVFDGQGRLKVNSFQGEGAAGAANFWTFRLSNGTTFYEGLNVGQLPAALVGGRLDVNIGASTSIPVTGTFWPGVQPVSGTFWQATQPVSIATMPSTPVTGTFWQATQPVSGTFFQATQPVSIASMPSTPVTGTFWQATQPVSIATMPSTPVTGTFWQATQPVSGTLALSNSFLLDATFTGRINTLGQKAMSASTPVVLASDQSTITVVGGLTEDAIPLSGKGFQTFPAKSTTTAPTYTNGATNPLSMDLAGNLRTSALTDTQLRAAEVVVKQGTTAGSANWYVNLSQVSGVGIATGHGVAAGTVRVELPTDGTGSVNARPVDSANVDLTSVKGTQTARGVGVQELKDAGRSAASYYATSAAAGATGVETLITLTKSLGTAATSTGTSMTPTSGKRFRITSILVGSQGHATATVQTTIFNFRINTAGACIVTSTPIVFATKTATPATSLAWDRALIPIGDGYELVGDGTLTFCISANAVFTTNAPTWTVSILGYEY